MYNSPIIYRRPEGRRYRPGTYIVDRKTKRLGVFVDYCPGCAWKIILDHDELYKIAHVAQKEEKSKDFKKLHKLLEDRTL